MPEQNLKKIQQELERTKEDLEDLQCYISEFSAALPVAVCSLSGIGDIIENGISCYFLEQRTPDASILQFASIVTNAKFLFLLLSIVIIVVKLLRKTS